MSDLTITHTAETGTLIEGTERGDGTNEALKANNWRWSRNLGSWYVPRSRDTIANTYKIGRTAEALRAAGHTVTVQIDNAQRDAATVEADRLAHEEDRAERTAERAERAKANAEAADKRRDQAFNALPDNGQPILVGHHSERRHRRAIANVDTAMRRSTEADQHAEEAEARAARAARATETRYTPQAVALKIERLTKEIRGHRRKLDGSSHTFSRGHVEVTPPAAGEYRERIQALHDQAADNLKFWEGIRAQQLESGQARVFSRETIKPGGYVQIRGRSWDWGEVAKANPKTVSVYTGLTYADGERQTLRYTYAEITDYREPTK